MRGFGLLGFLRYLEDKQVKVGKVTGVSIGGIVGALHTNGYSARQIEDIMKYELDSSCLKSLTQTHQFLRHPWRALSSHFVDTRPTMEDFVNKYQLKPQENLRLVSLNVLTWSPVVFEGTNYNLAQALAASSAIPGAMRPVWYKPPTNGYVPESMSHRGILVDGGAYRMTPSEFTDGHALIASISSPESLDGIETLKHLPQIMRPAILKALKTPYIESPGPDDLLVPVGKAEIDTLDFNLPNHQISALIDHGYTQAEANLDQHIAGGKIPILPLEQPAQIRPRARKPFAWRALFPAQAAS